MKQSNEDAYKRAVEVIAEAKEQLVYARNYVAEAEYLLYTLEQEGLRVVFIPEDEYKALLEAWENEEAIEIDIKELQWD